MTAIRATPPGPPQPDPAQLPRLVTPGPPAGLAAHLRRHGPVPALSGPALIASIEQAGLTGRGGAGFPAARKMRAVTTAASRRPGRGRRGGAPAVLANGAESEPASGKDTLLLRQSPHLVLDGIALAAQAVGATEAYLCVAGPQPAAALLAAVAERQRAGLPEAGVRVAAIPHGYVASEESALVNYLSGGPAVPRYVPPRPAERGVGGRPTLVHNVETLAHIALIARYGPDWFAAVGTPDAPGSALVTIGGAVRRPGVYEIALGRPVTELIELAGGTTEPPQAILAGGCFGGWLPLPAAAGVPVSPPGLRAAGAAFGSGLLTVLPATACVLAETARVLRYLAGQSARQCGPCTFGLPAIADALAQIAWQGRDRRTAEWLRYLLPVVANRGACHLPDGAVAVAASTIRSFSKEVEQHVTHGPCANASRPPVLPLPPTAPAGRP
ncbi:MAG TPA: NADH-ubiquinone oxidoreductase-F iron-sulfur binding region domain-containing protein [Streptosporangiaceae bacterium]|nr:NADH-ubiquinone oxidoreductase-F iron-sulfur binding region domain-containing protein [Streptosporangiaceae bacterium]